MRRTWLAVVVVAWASGCYATTEVPATQISSIARPLSAPRTLGGSAKLGPKTEIRAWLADGSVTPWLPAGGLAVGEDGLVSGRRHSLATAREATIAEAAAGAAEMLTATAPPGGEIRASADGELRLTVADRRVLLPWIAAYATGAKTMRQPLGWVSFRSHRDEWTSDWIPMSRFVGVAPAQLAKLEVAEGVPWRDVVGLQVHNLEPIRTTGAIIGMPIAVSAMLLGTVAAVAAAADGEDPTPGLNVALTAAAMTEEAAASADADADTRGAPVHSLRESPAVLVTADGTTPLFSGAARRREAIKFVFAGEAGLTGEGGLTGSAGLGFRAGDFVELSARLRALPFDNTLASMQGASSSAAAVNLLYGGRLALHIDGDGDRRTAFVFGGEVLGGSLRDGTALTELGFVLGPRFGISDKMFASLLFAPSLLIPAGAPSGEPSAVGQIMFTAELGFAL